MKKGGFELRKWVSNDSNLQAFFDIHSVIQSYVKYKTDSSLYSKSLCAKSKVPMKPLSIPRLELLGFELVTKLITDVKKAMGKKCEIS